MSAQDDIEAVDSNATLAEWRRLRLERKAARPCGLATGEPGVVPPSRTLEQRAGGCGLLTPRPPAQTL